MDEVTATATMRIEDRSPQEVISELEAGFAERAGYMYRRVEPDGLKVEGSYRTPMVVASAIILATVTFGVGLLLLLRRELESIHFTARDDGSGGTLLEVEGATSPRTDEIVTDLGVDVPVVAGETITPPVTAEPAVAPDVPMPMTQVAPSVQEEDATRIRPSSLDDDATRVTTALPVVRQPLLRITVDSGIVHDIESSALLGRNPGMREGDPADTALITVEDPDRSISKTHLAIRLIDGEAWIEDLDSTNGTAIVAADGASTPAPAGKAVFIQSGDTVTFGDRSFTLEWV